jgi:uncharacterized protein YecE (DUF72 family)
MTLRVGTIGWSYGFWKDTFYPPKLAPKNYLTYYASHFDTVEVDSTFYRIPTAKTITEWKNQTPESFKFSLKFPQQITHVKMLKDSQPETQLFLERAALLGEKLGVLLLQFPPLFRQRHFPLLVDYINALPPRHRYAVEVRNKSLLTPDLYQLLQNHGVALVWVDSPKMPFVAEQTAEFVYVRLEGDRKVVQGTLGRTEVDKSEEIATWATRLKPVAVAGRDVFCYFAKYFSGFPPNDVDELLNQASG